MEKNWYVIHTYSGFEGRVKASLEERIVSLGLEEKMGKVLVPTEEVVEIKDGKKRVSTKKFFPGYVLVEMCLDLEVQQLVKETPKVTGFLGGGGAVPEPLAEKEVKVLLRQMDEGVAPPREKALFDKGENVRIIDGPFLGFNGVVDEVNLDQHKVKVLVSIFGRSTPVELNFLQVEKV
ncbi:MAG: transcription termination/antitermination protein NusG [Nitrospira sp.]|nr:transcription termination/antitermination protein NusG [Candidatus Manganitrophaceae bacterium]HIL35142.1 transcription termination/antitermination protein NusG [Candidatus Manganitrophaceae bacterium]